MNEGRTFHLYTNDRGESVISLRNGYWSGYAAGRIKGWERGVEWAMRGRSALIWGFSFCGGLFLGTLLRSMFWN